MTSSTAGAPPSAPPARARTRLRPREVAEELWTPLLLCGLLIAAAIVVSATAGIGLQRTFVNAAITLLLVLGTSAFSGSTGVLSFGHVGFMAVGAYTSALLTIAPPIKTSLFADLPGFLAWVQDVELGFLPATLAAGAVAVVVATVIALPIARLDGIQASIATLAFLVIVNTIIVNWEEVTRGDSSVIGVPPDTTIATVTGWGVLVLLGLGAFRISRRGLRLRASADDVHAVRSLGVAITRDRAVAFALSAFPAGVAGSLFAHYNPTFSPRAFYLDLTFLTIAMLVVGGLRTMRGAVIGLVAVTLITELVQRSEDSGLGPIGNTPAGTTQIVVAAVLLVVLIRRPEGIAGHGEFPLPRRWRGVANARNIDKEGA